MGEFLADLQEIFEFYGKKFKIKRRVEDISGELIPVGAMIKFVGEKLPKGWLKCDGDSYFIQDYLDLYSVIGGTFGTLDNNVDTFKVPKDSGHIIKY